MEKLAIGLWGCFFGMTVVVLVGALVACRRGMNRIALNAALAAVINAFYVVAFLGGMGFSSPDHQTRFLAHLGLLTAGFFTYQLLVTLSILSSPQMRQRVVLWLIGGCATVLGVGWSLPPLHGLAISSVTGCLLAIFALFASLRNAVKGQRLAWAAVASVFFLLVAITGLAWIALDRERDLLTVHLLTALAATFYAVSMAHIIWSRYVYLFELHEVMAQGPSYDPVTRMRTDLGTNQMVSDVFRNFKTNPSPMGMVVLTIANLYALEKLHGPAAVNNALFVCAQRMRRWVPGQVEMGRLGTDGFILVMQHCSESKKVIDLARALESRLRRSVRLNTSLDLSQLDSSKTVWVAEIGVGVLTLRDPNSRGSDAMEMGRRMSRTAMSYASRIAWFDHSSGEAVELPDNRLL